MLSVFLVCMVSLGLGGTEQGTDEVVASPWDEQKFSIPLREISVIVTKEGYFPDNISVFSGEKVKFFVTSVDEKPLCMILPTYSLYLSAHLGKIAEGEVFFDRPGIFEFHCPAGGQRGKVTVLAKKVYQQRSVASDKNKETIWRPSAAPVSY
jgi:hypothetical protein